jgi:hypothetical protein
LAEQRLLIARLLGSDAENQRKHSTRSVTRTARLNPDRLGKDSVSRSHSLLLAMFAFSCRAGGQPVPASRSSRAETLRVSESAQPAATAMTEKDRWRLGCDSGDQTACNNLAFLIEQSEPEKAQGLYAKACEEDNAAACHNLGFVIYHQGNVERAISSFVKACGLSHAAACDTLRSWRFRRKMARLTTYVRIFSSPGNFDDLMQDFRKPP